MNFEQTANILNETVFVYDVLPGCIDMNMPDILYSKKSDRIIANKAWLQLDPLIKDVSVAHEMGHRDLRHGFRYSSDSVRLINEELDADAYACRVLTTEQVLAAFNQLIEIFEKGNPALWKPAVDELYFRRRWILNNYDYM